MELLVLAPFVGFVFFWQRWQASSVSAAALHVCSAIILLLFVAGLVGWLPEMRILLLGLGTGLLAVELFRHHQQHLRTLGSVPMLTLVVLCLLFFFVHRHTGFRFYDEFSHWGIFLKDMLANGGFWTAETNSLHARYAPGPTLWQYLFVFSATPREGAAYFAQFLLLMIPLLVLFESLRWKQVGWVAGIVVLVLFGFANFGHGIVSLYADHVVAAWLAGLFLNFMAEPGDRPLPALGLYVLPLAVLGLTKNAGLFFALALPLLLLVLLFLRRRGVSPRGKMKRVVPALVVLCVWIAGPLLVNYGWSHNRDAAGATGAGALSAPSLVDALTGKVTAKQARRASTVRTMFKDVFLNQQLSKDRTSDQFNEFSYDLMPLYEDRFRMTTASFLLLFMTWSAFVILVIVPKPLRYFWSAGLAGMLAIALGYIVILFLTYLLFRDDMVSYIRYVHSATLPLLLVGLAPLLPAFSHARTAPPDTGAEASHMTAPAAFTFALLALLLAERPHFESLARRPPSQLTTFRAEIQPLTETVRGSVGQSRLWMYLPDSNPHNFTSRIMLYELSPTPTTVNRSFDFFDRSRDEILADWAAFDFVWVPLEGPELDRKLAAVVGPDLGERLYRVEARDDTVQITLVETDRGPAE